MAVTLGAVLAAGALELSLQVASLALRASDAERAERDGPLAERRVLCLGACYTVGVGSPPELSYPSQLEEIISERGGDAVSVINGGVRGQSITFFARYINGMLREARPEILIINVNDRLVYSANELAEAAANDSAWSEVGRRMSRTLSHSLLYRAVSLAVSEPPPTTGLPGHWWSDGRAGADGRDFLALQIEELEAAVQATPRDATRWLELAAFRAERLDYEGAIEAAQQAASLEGEESTALRRSLLDYNIGLRRYGEAQRILARIRDDHAYELASEADLESRSRSLQGVKGRIRYKILRAEHLAIYGDLQEAVRLSEAIVLAMPGKVSANDRRDFYRALHEAGDEPLPERAPIRSDALFAKSEQALTGAGRLGLYEEDADPMAQADSETAARFYRQALASNLVTILSETEPLGVHVVVENLSSLPDQQPIIRETCEALGLPLVDLQGALARHPDREALLHPEQNLRLSPAGNRLIAETLYAAMVDQGLL